MKGSWGERGIVGMKVVSPDLLRSVLRRVKWSVRPVLSSVISLKVITTISEDLRAPKRPKMALILTQRLEGWLLDSSRN